MIATAMDETTTTGDRTAALPVMIGGTLGIEETAHGHTLEILTIATMEIDIRETVDMAVITANMSTVIAVMKMIIITIPLVTRMSAIIAEKELA